MEAVVKVGGSLAKDASALRALCKTLGTLAQRHRILVVPGGGVLADAVRQLDRAFALSDLASHRMATLAMDQFGLLLASLTPNAQAVTGLGAARRFSKAGKLPILLPSRLTFLRDPLKPSWDVTSDSIAAYVAGLLKAGKLILVKDVNGVFTADPKLHPDATLIEALSARELTSLGHGTCVDAYLPRILAERALECYVVSGRYPERVGAVLRGEQVVGTRLFT